MPGNVIHIGALALLGGAVTALAAFPAPAAPTGMVKARLLTSVSAAQPDKPFDVGVLFTIGKGWHIYWKNPGDAGLPTSVEWKLPDGFSAGPLRWPTPQTFQQPGNIVGYGYEGSVMLVATVTPSKDLTTGKEVTIGAEVSWLACGQLCVPGSEALTMPLPAAASARPANQRIFNEWEAKTPQPAPDFAAKDQDGHPVSLSDYKGRVLVLEWFNPDCPFVQRHHAERTTMIDLAAKYAPRVAWLAINSTYYMPARTTAEWRGKWKMNYPVLIDRDGKIARAYGARTTPDMFVIDRQGDVVYEGAIDNDPSGRLKEPVNYVDKALSELLSDRPINTPKTKPYGCSVKYPPEGKAGDGR